LIGRKLSMSSSRRFNRLRRHLGWQVYEPGR
jgi:hypothetical protein